MTSSMDSLLDVFGDYVSRGEILWNSFDEEIEKAIDRVIFNAMYHVKDVHLEAYEILHSLWLADKKGEPR